MFIVLTFDGLASNIKLTLTSVIIDFLSQYVSSADSRSWTDRQCVCVSAAPGIGKPSSDNCVGQGEGSRLANLSQRFLFTSCMK